MSLSNASDFSDPNFDAINWVNSSIELKGNTDDLDSFLSGLSMKVQVLSQDCSDSIESQMHNLLTRLPDMVHFFYDFIIIDDKSNRIRRKNGRTQR